MSLTQPQIIPPAQQAFLNNVIAYANDQLYGTNTCTYTLDQLVAQMLLLIQSVNNCNALSVQQLQCILGLLQQQTGC